MKKKTIWIVVLAIAVVAAVVWGYNSFNQEEKLPVVETEEVSLGSITQTVFSTGKIKPEVEISISPEVPGEIVELPVVEGQAVKKGELLARINPDLLEASVSRSQAGVANAQANYEQAKASLAEAEANFKRSSTLYEKGVISRSDYDTALANYERAKGAEQSAFFSVKSARATLNEASDNLSRTTIYAPMDGTISLLAVELGERVVGTQQMAGTELMRVADLSKMEVEVEVNENDIVKVSLGDEAIVEVDAYPKKAFKGVVIEIANTASGETLTANQVTNFLVKVRILPSSYQDLLEGKPDNFSPFKPGMTATVEIITEKKNKVLTIPISSIVLKQASELNENNDTLSTDDRETERREAVFTYETGKASLNQVQTGIQDESRIEVLSGLKEGDLVITGPYDIVTKNLENGDQVNRESSTTEDQ